LFEGQILKTETNYLHLEKNTDVPVFFLKIL